MLEYAATALSMLGAVLVALGRRWALVGFLVWIVSNIAWVAFSWLNGHIGMVVMFGFYLATSTIGAVNACRVGGGGQ